MAAAHAKATGRIGVCLATSGPGGIHLANGLYDAKLDHAWWARGCGGFGVSVDKPADLPGALREALAHPGPALVDVAVDPNEPPLPGKVSYDQAKKFAIAWLRGQPNKAAMATTLFKDRIQQLKS
jgi:pyruvate dehydrogenase (quinone)/pyruvate oxidase